MKQMGMDPVALANGVESLWIGLQGRFRKENMLVEMCFFLGGLFTKGMINSNCLTLQNVLEAVMKQMGMDPKQMEGGQDEVLGVLDAAFEDGH